MDKFEEKFWAKVDKSGDCWIWKGDTQGPGRYGRVTRYLGTKRFREYAHRISYRLHYGSIKKGMLVCHKCDNPPCVNPDHLFLGTHRDNMLDMFGKKRRSLDSIELRFCFNDPGGNIITGQNLNQLCRTYGLHYRSINLVHRGLKDNYKGWRKV